MKEPMNEVEQLLYKNYKKRKWNKTGILLVLCLLLSAIGYWVWQEKEPGGRYELERDALEGFLPGRSETDIQNELNRIIEGSRLNISMNPNLQLQGGMLNVMIENVPANNYYIQVDTYIYTDEKAEKREQIYESGMIKQGFYVMEGKAMMQPEPGTYNGIAVFTALYPETLEEIGQVGMNVVVTVP